MCLRIAVIWQLLPSVEHRVNSVVTESTIHISSPNMSHKLYKYFLQENYVKHQGKKSLQCQQMHCSTIMYKAISLQAQTGPEGSRRLRPPDFMTTAQDGGKIVSPTHRTPLLPGNIPGTHFCQMLSRPQCHNEAGRIMLMKNSNDTIGNRTRALQHLQRIASTKMRHLVSALLCISYPIISYKFWLNWQLQGANTYVTKAQNNKIILQCLRISKRTDYS